MEKQNINIGLMHFSDLTDIPIKEIIYFDKISIPLLSESIKYAYDNKTRSTEFLSHLEFLIKENIIFETQFENASHKDYYSFLQQRGMCIEQNEFPFWSDEDINQCLNAVTYRISDGKSWGDDMDFFGFGVMPATFHAKCIFTNKNYFLLKYLAIYLNRLSYSIYTPILYSLRLHLHYPETYNLNIEKWSNQIEGHRSLFYRIGNVANVHIHSILLPDKNTPLSQIVDFKKSEIARIKISAIKLWLNKLGCCEQSIDQIKQEFKTLFIDYTRYIRLNKFTFSKQTFTPIIIVDPGISNNISKIMNEYFDIIDKKMPLLQSETNLFGKEIAFASFL
jgi:hypothetical protein